MTSETRQRLIQSIPWVFAVWTVAILALMLAPRESFAGQAPFAVAKIAHVVAFGGWTFLLGLYITVYRRQQRLPVVPLLLAGITFGALVELGQFLLPLGRSGSIADTAINAVGVSGALLVLKWMRHRSVQTD